MTVCNDTPALPSGLNASITIPTRSVMRRPVCLNPLMAHSAGTRPKLGNTWKPNGIGMVMYLFPPIGIISARSRTNSGGSSSSNPAAASATACKAPNVMPPYTMAFPAFVSPTLPFW